MKILIEQSTDCRETEIKVTCSLIDPRLKKLIETIRLYSFSIPAQNDSETVSVAPETIYYFESVDSRTFLYLEHNVFLCDKKLYELENILEGTSFVRVSKSCILNTSFVSSVRAQFSGRLEARMKNGEKVLISRHYLKDFREKFGIWP